ncbi:MAG: hypothetical protein J2P15_11490 [Micromonosporaceae bacterium]|nr:hypothetical protein [Micromonosporaceae bacterium]
MGIISPSTFDPLLAYVNVRLQQGVPLLDADLNETDDIRKFELRAFLKWYVGDGVPEGGDGFRIVGGLSNDFTIAAGAPVAPGGTGAVDIGLRYAGRCIVDGLDVLIQQDTAFTAQPLHQDQPAAAALATLLGVPVIARLSTPGADTQVLAYLDVWERLVTPDEQPALVHAGLGVETCARIRREWVVRTRTGTAVPQSGDSDFLAGHAYLPLAQLRRRAGVGAITTDDVRDLRQQRLLLPPAHLLADTLAVSDAAAYRRGENRPAVSLREAVNALLAGQLPSTPDLAVSPAPGVDLARHAYVLDASGGVCAFWQSPRVANLNQIIGARFDPARPPATLPLATPVTSGTVHLSPTAVALPNGDVVVAYQTGLNGAADADIVLRRAPYAGLPAAAEVPVAATAGTADQVPHAVLAGDFVVFFSHQASTNTWRYRRYRHTDGTFPDATPQQLSAVTPTVQDLHAAATPSGMVFVAFSDGANMQLLRLAPVTATIDLVASVPAAGVLDVFVVATGTDDALVFWHDGTGLRTIATTGGPPPTGWAAAATIAGSTTDEAQPAAVTDADGTVFLFAAKSVPDASTEIFMRRRNPVTHEWGLPQRVISSPQNDLRPHPVLVAGQGIWVFWQSDRSGNFDVFTKRLITAI